MNMWKQLSLAKTGCYYTLSELSSVEPLPYMDLALKYILVLFITCSCKCHCKQTMFLSQSWRCKAKRDWGHNKWGCCKCLWLFQKLNRHQWTRGPLKQTADATGVWCASIKIGLMMNSSIHSQSSFFVKRFFSELWRLNSCLKLQKTIPDYYFYSNNWYNRASVHIIRTVILNWHVTHGWLLRSRRCRIWSMMKVCYW